METAQILKKRAFAMESRSAVPGVGPSANNPAGVAN